MPRRLSAIEAQRFFAEVQNDERRQREREREGDSDWNGTPEEAQIANDGEFLQCMIRSSSKRSRWKQEQVEPR